MKTSQCYLGRSFLMGGLMDKKKYRSIIVDIDNTLTQLQFTVDKISKVHNLRPYCESEITSFNFKEVMGLADDTDNKFWKNHEQYIVRNVPYMRERTEVIKRNIDMDYLEEIHLVSNRPVELYEDTEYWLEKHGIEYTSLTLIGKEDKAKVISDKFHDADALFEDNPAVINGLINYPKTWFIETWMIEYPYNKGTNATYTLCRDTGEILLDNSEDL